MKGVERGQRPTATDDRTDRHGEFGNRRQDYGGTRFDLLTEAHGYGDQTKSYGKPTSSRASRPLSCCDPRDFLQAELESDPKEGPDHEAIEVHGRAGYCGAAGAG